MGAKRSVSKTESLFCKRTANRSKPAPPSTLLNGNSSKLPSSLRLYIMKTPGFQISKKRSQLQPGRQSFFPQPNFSPRSKQTSLQGPKGPVGPETQRFSQAGKGTILSFGKPTFCQKRIESSSFSISSSPAKTVAQSLSGSSLISLVKNSQARAIASSLK